MPVLLKPCLYPPKKARLCEAAHVADRVAFFPHAAGNERMIRLVYRRSSMGGIR